MPRVKRPRSRDRNLTCKVCNTTCDDLASLQSHMKTHPGVYCKACGNTYSKKQTFQNHRCYTEHCNICDKKFHTEKDLEKHNKECHIGPWNCISLGCNAGEFNDQLTLRDHYLENHIENLADCPKPWRCKVIKDPPTHRCAQWFATRSAVNRHISSLAGYKPYSCNICSRQYVEKWQVTAHVKAMHAHEEFIWSCCKIFFTTKQKFTEHMRYDCPTKGQHARSSRRIPKKVEKKKRAPKARVKRGSSSRGIQHTRQRDPSTVTPDIYKNIALHYQECLRCHRFGEQRFELVLCTQCKQGLHHRCITKGHKAPLTYLDLSTWKCSQCEDLSKNSTSSLKSTLSSKFKIEKRTKKECQIVSLSDVSTTKLQTVVASCGISGGKELKPGTKFVSVVDIDIKKPPQVLVRDIVGEHNLCKRY